MLESSCMLYSYTSFVLAGSIFGPDYRHFKGTAFGFYADGFGGMSESGWPIEPLMTVIKC